MNLKTIHQLSVSGRRVFLRADFNVPLEKDGKILDDTRIREALPTIRYLLDQKAKIIIASHLGRPQEKNPQDSLEGVAARLAELLDREVLFPEDCVGDGVRKLAHELREGEVLLLENLRFHKEEEANDPQFAASLAQLAEVYVSEAFGTLHRAHASTEGMVGHFKEKGIGLLIRKELDFLEKLLKDPERPFCVVLGGAKVSDKMALIENLLGRTEGLLLGGGLAYTFLKAKGMAIGRSQLAEEKLYLAQKVLQRSKETGVPIYLPEDHRVGDRISPEVTPRTVTQIGPEDMGLDIGPLTIRRYEEVLKGARTIFWNGPMGVFELPAFAEGTFAIARAIAGATSQGAVSVVGGGESLAAVRKSRVAGQITHLSTGGGATLEFLEGRKLPGLKVLEN